MPTFSTPPSGSHGVLASAALSHVDSAHVPISSPSAGVSPTSGMTDMAGLTGFEAVPPKLIKCIWSLEYVDMWELLPEAWREDTLQSGCCHSKRPRRELVTNISIWTECYATLAAILSIRYPAKAPQLMAYLKTITRASRNYEGATWATYDAAFRR